MCFVLSPAQRTSLRWLSQKQSPAIKIVIANVVKRNEATPSNYATQLLSTNKQYSIHQGIASLRFAMTGFEY